MNDPVVKHGWHWSFGWLRRSDMDANEMHCYETPDGDLIYTHRPEHREQVYLDCRRDQETGEEYTCLARFPRRASPKRRTC